MPTCGGAWPCGRMPTERRWRANWRPSLAGGEGRGDGLRNQNAVYPRSAEGSAHVFREYATEIKIVDKAAGEFLEVSQTGRTDLGKIAINPEEWPTLQLMPLTG